MSQLHELYHELILDHGRNPRHFGELPRATCTAEGFNPLCGDKLKLYIAINDVNKKIESIQFSGEGCAISMASASMMAEHLEGKTISEAHEMFGFFCKQVTLNTPQDKNIIDKLGKLAVLSGVRTFPSRVKCATLAWHTLQTALNQPGNTTTTE